MKYPYFTYDNVINQELQKEVWSYLLNQTYHAKRKTENKNNDRLFVVKYKPIDGKKEYLTTDLPNVNEQYMHRTIFGNNEEDLKQHFPIFKLWNEIKKTIVNNWSIEGNPEGFSTSDLSKTDCRVYVNIQPNERIKRSHTIHSDSNDLTEGKNYTLLYIANPVWYPSWFAENIFYETDTNSEDKQQFHKGYGQSRNYGIGEPYAVVPPKPGRVILYDGRTLHTTRPTAIWAEEMRYAIAFRIKKN